MTRKILIPVIVAVVGLGVVGATVASAQTNTPLSGLAQMIAQKFNLDQNQVQGVINQYRQQQKTNMQQNIQQRLKSKLDAGVSAGKITSSQEQAIINELNTLRSQNNPGNFKNMTPAQRQQAFQNIQNQLKSWAQSQGIDPALIPFGGFGMGGRGMHRGWNYATPSPSPSPS